jgi:carbohydrate esterase-like sialic acid-specific acetylesterase
MSRSTHHELLLRVAVIACWTLAACSSTDSPTDPAAGGAASAGAAGSSGSAGVAVSGASASGVSGGGASQAGTGGALAGSAGIASGGSDHGGSGDSGSLGGGSGGGSSGASGAAGTAGAAGAANRNAVNVFLIGGQSNATGQGYTKNYPREFMIDERVQLYHSTKIISSTGGNVWGPLRHASERADNCGDRFGPELGFGNEVQALYPGRHIAIIKHATSGTDLVSDWVPGSSPTDAAHFGAEFKIFVATVDSGLKALKDKGLEPKIVGMLWQQGEADVDLMGTAASEYGQHLSALIARVREQWSVPDMLFVYGFVYPKSKFGLARDQVRAAEANVDQDSGNALAVHHAFVVNTDDLELRKDDPGTCYADDLTHFGTAGQLELGKRFATKTHDHLVLP